MNQRISEFGEEKGRSPAWVFPHLNGVVCVVSTNTVKRSYRHHVSAADDGWVNAQNIEVAVATTSKGHNHARSHLPSREQGWRSVAFYTAALASLGITHSHDYDGKTTRRVIPISRVSVPQEFCRLARLWQCAAPRVLKVFAAIALRALLFLSSLPCNYVHFRNYRPQPAISRILSLPLVPVLLDRVRGDFKRNL
jgi:hypothetical protein